MESMSRGRHALWRYSVEEALPSDMEDAALPYALSEGDSLGSLWGNLVFAHQDRAHFTVLGAGDAFLGFAGLRLVACHLAGASPSSCAAVTVDSMSKANEDYSKNVILDGFQPRAPSFDAAHKHFKARPLDASASAKRPQWDALGRIVTAAPLAQARAYEAAVLGPVPSPKQTLHLNSFLYDAFLQLSEGYDTVPVCLADDSVVGLAGVHCAMFLQRNFSDVFPSIDYLGVSVSDLHLVRKSVETSVHATLGSSLMALLHHRVDGLAVIDEDGKVGGRFTLDCVAELGKLVIARHWDDMDDFDPPSVASVRQQIRHGDRFEFEGVKAEFSKSLILLQTPLRECEAIGVRAMSFVGHVFADDEESDSEEDEDDESGIGSDDDEHVNAMQKLLLDAVKRKHKSNVAQANASRRADAAARRQRRKKKGRGKGGENDGSYDESGDDAASLRRAESVASTNSKVASRRKLDRYPSKVSSRASSVSASRVLSTMNSVLNHQQTRRREADPADPKDHAKEPYNIFQSEPPLPAEKPVCMCTQ